MMKKRKVKFIPRKIHVKSNDMVYVISGKDKGKIGKVLKVFPKQGKIVVEGVNLITKHIKSSQGAEGGKVQVPAPIYSCKAMFYSEAHGVRSRINKKVLEDGSKVRYLKKIDEIV